MIDLKKPYCRPVVEIVKTQSKVAQVPAVQENLNVLKEVLVDWHRNTGHDHFCC